MKKTLMFVLDVVAAVMLIAGIGILICVVASFAAHSESLVKYEIRPATADTFDNSKAEVYGIVDNADGSATLSMDACGSLVNATWKVKRPLDAQGKALMERIEEAVNKKLLDCCKDPKTCTE